MNKQTAILIASTAVFVLAILVVISLNSKTSNPSGSQVGSQVAAGVQSGDSMHGGTQPTNSTVFNSLVGKKAPDFTLTSYDGKTYTLSSLKGKNVVLFFNEGLMCYPACWNQIASFGTDSRFNNSDTIALNIVEDNKNDWASAIGKMPDLAKATILFDNNTVSQTYGTLNLPSSMHRGQLPGHTYIIVDKQGIVRYVLDDPNMALGNDNLINQISKF